MYYQWVVVDLHDMHSLADVHRVYRKLRSSGHLVHLALSRRRLTTDPPASSHQHQQQQQLSQSAQHPSCILVVFSSAEGAVELDKSEVLCLLFSSAHPLLSPIPTLSFPHIYSLVVMLGSHTFSTHECGCVCSVLCFLLVVLTHLHVCLFFVCLRSGFLLVFAHFP